MWGLVNWYQCVRGSSWTSATGQVGVLDIGVDEPGETDLSCQLTVSEQWLYVRCYATCLSGIISLDLNINLARSILLISSGMVSNGWSNNSLQKQQLQSKTSFSFTFCEGQKLTTAVCPAESELCICSYYLGPWLKEQSLFWMCSQCKKNARAGWTLSSLF